MTPVILGAGAEGAELTELSLEELMNLEVTSVSKKKQELARVPAAVYVLPGEQIQRSGATNVPDATANRKLP